MYLSVLVRGCACVIRLAAPYGAASLITHAPLRSVYVSAATHGAASLITHAPPRSVYVSAATRVIRLAALT